MVMEPVYCSNPSCILIYTYMYHVLIWRCMPKITPIPKTLQSYARPWDNKIYIERREIFYIKFQILYCIYQRQSPEGTWGFKKNKTVIVNRYIKLCNPFLRISNSFPRNSKLVLSDWNSFPRIRQSILSSWIV